MTNVELLTSPQTALNLEPGISTVKSPEIAYLSSPELTLKTVQTLLQDRPIVLNGGPMYGTVFLPHLRASIASARGEAEPWETVSVITTWNQARNWIDYQQLNPKIAPAIRSGSLTNLTSLMFTRFPANLETVDPTLKQYCINSHNEIQVFLMPDDYPLLNALGENGHHSLLVRSANLHNQPEALDFAEALKYAPQIGAQLIVLNKPDYLIREPYRKRVGGNNILRFGSFPEVDLLRQGNTSLETTQRLLNAANLLPQGISLTHHEAKIRPLVFRPYDCPPELVSLAEITADLLESGGL